MAKIWSRENLFFLTLLPLAVVVGFITYGFFKGYLTEEQATVAISAMGVLATVSLVSATITTIEQNRRTIQDLELDREKPIYADIVRQIVVPTRVGISEIKTEIKKGRILPSSAGFGSFSPISPEVNPVLWKRFKSEHPELVNKIERVDSEILEVKNHANDLVEDIEKTLSEEFPHKKVDFSFFGVKFVSPGRNSIPDGTGKRFWNHNRDEIKEIVHGHHYNKIHEQRLKEYQLFKTLEDLREQTLETEDEIRTKYGIPIEE